MKKVIIFLMLAAALFSIASCTQKQQEVSKEITVSAAASLRDVLSEIQMQFEKEKSIKLNFNFASSGTLQKQIEEGAPVDLFISAGKKQMDALEEKKLIDLDSRKDMLRNKLVLIVPDEYKEDIKTPSDLSDKNIKISIGEPESVPAGQYAKDSLIFLNLWDKLIDKIVYAKDVKQVVAYVENGEVAAGVVYSSDATVIKNSTVVYTFDENSHKPIIYPAAIISTSKKKNTAKEFYDYLQTDYSKQAFEKYGFNMN